MLKYYFGGGRQLFTDFCFLEHNLREKRGMSVVDTNNCSRYFNGWGTGI